MLVFVGNSLGFVGVGLFFRAGISQGLLLLDVLGEVTQGLDIVAVRDVSYIDKYRSSMEDRLVNVQLRLSASRAVLIWSLSMPCWAKWGAEVKGQPYVEGGVPRGSVNRESMPVFDQSLIMVLWGKESSNARGAQVTDIRCGINIERAKATIEADCDDKGTESRVID